MKILPLMELQAVKNHKRKDKMAEKKSVVFVKKY